MKKVLVILLTLFITNQKATNFWSSKYTYRLNGDSISWPSRSTKNAYITSSRFAPCNVLATRVQTKGLYAILAFPRLRPGVPITLGKIKLIVGQGAPDIEPYPNWDMQEEGNADALQNVVDIYLDEWSILWALDIGRQRVIGFEFFSRKIKYDVNISCYFPLGLSKPSNLIVEYILGKPHLYISDPLTNCVLVCDVKNCLGSKINLPISKKCCDALNMVLVRSKSHGNILVFSYLESSIVFGISTVNVRLGRNNIINLGQSTGSMVLLGTDNGSKVYFRWRGESKIRMWDIDNGLKGAVLIDEGKDYRMSTHVTGGSRLLMWSLESNFNDFIMGKVGNVGASVVLRALESKTVC